MFARLYRLRPIAAKFSRSACAFGLFALVDVRRVLDCIRAIAAREAQEKRDGAASAFQARAHIFRAETRRVILRILRFRQVGARRMRNNQIPRADIVRDSVSRKKKRSRHPGDRARPA